MFALLMHADIELSSPMGCSGAGAQVNALSTTVESNHFLSRCYFFCSLTIPKQNFAPV